MKRIAPLVFSLGSLILAHLILQLWPIVTCAQTPAPADALNQKVLAEKYPPGLIVFSVTEGSKAEQAGLKVGDVLITFNGTPVRFVSQIGPLRDKALADGKKTIEIAIRRGTEGITISLTLVQIFDFNTRPPLPPQAQLQYDAAIVIPRVQAATAIEKFKAAAASSGDAGDYRAASWIWSFLSAGSKIDPEQIQYALIAAQRCGDESAGASALHSLGVSAYNRGRLGEAEEYWKRALTLREELAPDSLDLAATLNNLGSVDEIRGKLDDAVAYHKRALVIRAKLAPDSLDVAGSLNNLGNVAVDRGRLDDAQMYYVRALTIQNNMAPNSLIVAGTLNHLGIVAKERGKLDEAQDYLSHALIIKEKLAPNSLDLAETLTNLGSVSRLHGRLDEAEAYYNRALVIWKKLAPDSRDMAGTLNNLGNLANDRDKLDEAESYLKSALTLIEKLAPESVSVAASLNNLGIVAFKHGKLDEAAAYYVRALMIQEERSPESLDLAEVLNNLGNVADERGKLMDAEAYHLRALVIREKLAPNSLVLAETLNNLGIIAGGRGKFDEAEAYYKNVLKIAETQAPDSLYLASTLGSIGNVTQGRGKLDEAEAYYKRELTITERLAPKSLMVASTLNDLGNVSWRHGRLDEAQAYYRRGLMILQKLAPDSIVLAHTLNNLGSVAEARGNMDEAASYLKHALTIQKKLAPGSLGLAATFSGLGSIGCHRGKLNEAEVRYRAAWMIVKQQGAQVVGDTGRQEFGKTYSSYSANLTSVQLKLNKSTEALITLEEGRAQALVAQMAQHGITEAATPPAVWLAYHEAETAHNVAYKDAELAEAKVEKAKAALLASQEQKGDDATLRQKRQDVDEAVKTFETLHLAEIRTRERSTTFWVSVLRAVKKPSPTPLDPGKARLWLPRDTLLLEFSVGEGEVTLFAVTSKRIRARVLPTNRAALEALVSLVRGSVTGDADTRSVISGSSSKRSLSRGPKLAIDTHHEIETFRRLYQQLFTPNVQREIRAAKHIVISPDGFLWNLPFAALIVNSSGTPDYLGLQKRLSYAQSLTVLTTPAPVRSGVGRSALVIGNPIYDNGRRPEYLALAKRLPASNIAGKSGSVKVVSVGRDYELGMMTVDGRAPDQLPGAEKEAASVAALYHTTAHTGIEPTEAWLRQHIADARIIHLATHGFLNSYSAQSSGLLLAIPEKAPPVGQYDNDGALQAWEVWTLKLKADLVVLSACETGRGKTVTGEGLIGLTRAFQYAGAKTIVSSQWKVNDASTAALMTSFHKHLISGAERDEALRLAMLEIANSKTPGWSSPYHWAAFVMVGETGRMR